MKREGQVVIRKVAHGSKSEHEAVCLVTDDDELILRRRGENPFHDKELHRLAGKRIRAKGIQAHQMFIMTEWEEL